jgi:hypothetical protein
MRAARASPGPHYIAAAADAQTRRAGAMDRAHSAIANGLANSRTRPMSRTRSAGCAQGAMLWGGVSLVAFLSPVTRKRLARPQGEGKLCSTSQTSNAESIPIESTTARPPTIEHQRQAAPQRRLGQANPNRPTLNDCAPTLRAWPSSPAWPTPWPPRRAPRDTSCATAYCSGARRPAPRRRCRRGSPRTTRDGG